MTIDGRIGFLEISLDLLDEKPDLFETYLSDCEIIDIKQTIDTTSMGFIIYKVRCPEFDDLLIGDAIPYYTFTWNKLDDGCVIRLPVERI